MFDLQGIWSRFGISHQCMFSFKIDATALQREKVIQGPNERLNYYNYFTGTSTMFWILYYIIFWVLILLKPFLRKEGWKRLWPLCPHDIFDPMDPWPRFDVKRLIGRRFKDSTVQKASGFGRNVFILFYIYICIRCLISKHISVIFAYLHALILHPSFLT